jgi:hypothetical protein
VTKEFVPYGLAVKLKALGFNEPCFGYYLEDGTWVPASYSEKGTVYPSNTDLLPEWSAAPTYQQAFRWFREKHGLCIVIKPIDDKNLELGYNLLKNGLMMGSYLTYEEAESACLIKLIELAEARI